MLCMCLRSMIYALLRFHILFLSIPFLSILLFFLPRLSVTHTRSHDHWAIPRSNNSRCTRFCAHSWSQFVQRATFASVYEWTGLPQQQPLNRAACVQCTTTRGASPGSGGFRGCSLRFTSLTQSLLSYALSAAPARPLHHSILRNHGSPS